MFATAQATCFPSPVKRNNYNPWQKNKHYFMIAGKNTRLTNSAFSTTTKAVVCIFWFCACCNAKRSHRSQQACYLANQERKQRRPMTWAMFTRDRTGTNPKRIQTDPKLDLLFCRSSFGSVWIRSGPVPERSRVKRRPIRSDFRTGSIWIRLEPVPCNIALVYTRFPALRSGCFNIGLVAPCY